MIQSLPSPCAAPVVGDARTLQRYGDGAATSLGRVGDGAHAHHPRDLSRM
jgi:hypothetical protein